MSQEVIKSGKLVFILSWLSTIFLASCSTITTTEYEATARTTYTWQVEYAVNPNRDNLTRARNFASTSLVNRNGMKPEDAVTGPDDKGLWWAALPPRPTVDEIEQRQKFSQKPSSPQLIKSVNYQLSFTAKSRQQMPTNYQVYRQVVKAYPHSAPLKLILGINNNTVEKAQLRDE